MGSVTRVVCDKSCAVQEDDPTNGGKIANQSGCSPVLVVPPMKSQTLCLF